jgi:hypothetical protein
MDCSCGKSMGFEHVIDPLFEFQVIYRALTRQLTTGCYIYQKYLFENYACFSLKMHNSSVTIVLGVCAAPLG